MICAGLSVTLFKLKVGAPVTSTLVNVQTSFGLSALFGFELAVRAGQTDRQMDRRARRLIRPMTTA